MKARRFATTKNLAIALWVVTVGLAIARTFGEHEHPLLAWLLVAGAGAATASVLHRMDFLTKSIVDAMGYQIQMNGHATDGEGPDAKLLSMPPRRDIR